MSNIEFGSSRFLVGLIGIDYRLLMQSPRETKTKFALASGFIITIMVLTLISVFYAFELMFHKWYIEIFLALFISLLFGTIYVLLIQTFSKQPLGLKGARSMLNESNIIRGVFILFIGFLISKPLEILMFNRSLNRDIENYRITLKQEFGSKSDQLFARDLAKLMYEFNKVQLIGIAKDTEAIKTRINDLVKKKEVSQYNAGVHIDASDFLLKRIQLIDIKYPASKLIGLIIIALFTAPVVIIYSISAKSVYYQLKQESDEKLVKEHYDLFCVEYSLLFLNKFGLERTFYEVHKDPPFRTVRIPPPFFESQETYFKSLEP